MTSTIKAIITDLDGTAVDAPKERIASKRLADAVSRLHEKGVKVCAATGRSINFARPMFDSMKLCDPAIVSGGSLIVDPMSEKELWSCKIDEEAMREILRVLASRNYSNYFWNNYDEQVYWNGGWALEKLSSSESIYFFGILVVPKDEVAGLKQQLDAITGISVIVVTGQREGAREFHITNAAATKEHAIHELERLIGVSRQESVGIGDGHNDIHLFNAVGYKVAMANAVPELKNVADRVIGSVHNEGLAEYFEELSENDRA